MCRLRELQPILCLVVDQPKSTDLTTEKRKVPGPFRYCDPSVVDENGGKFVTDDPRLGAFHDGDIVGVEGELAGESPGKARHRAYTVREVWLVKAKP